MIKVTPEQTLSHEKVKIFIEQTLPEHPYTLHLNAFNGLKLNTDSVVHFQSNSNGTIDLEVDKPLVSSPNLYSKVIDSMGMFRIMRFRPGYDVRYWNTDVFSPLTCTLNLHEGHLKDVLQCKPVASKIFTRSFVKKGVRREVIREGRIKGTLFLPPAKNDGKEGAQTKSPSDKIPSKSIPLARRDIYQLN